MDMDVLGPYKNGNMTKDIQATEDMDESGPAAAAASAENNGGGASSSAGFSRQAKRS
jgi:hypothetical protein